MKKSKINALILASAIVWAAAIIGCALVLRDSPQKEQVSRLVLGGVIFHLLFIWAPLGSELRKKN